MKNNIIDNVAKGGRMEKAIKRRFPFASQGAVSLLVIELRGLVNPVFSQLREEAKEWQKEAEDMQGEAGSAEDKIESLKADIECVELEVIRQKMLKQFYSY